MKDFRDFVKTTYTGLMEVERLNEAKKVLPITDAIKNHSDTVDKLGNLSRVSNSSRTSKAGKVSHKMSFYTDHPKLSYVTIEHEHEPSTSHHTGEHHSVHVTAFPKKTKVDELGLMHWPHGHGEGESAHEAYDKAMENLKYKD